MAKCERMGDAVLGMSEVKVARVIEDAEPALRLLLRETRGRGKVVHIGTESPTEAYAWMGDLAGLTGLTRLGRALVPERAQEVVSYKVKVEGGE